MICLDSSIWIEYFTNGSLAGAFEKAVRDEDKLLVPSICLLEVHKYIALHHGERLADEVLVSLKRARVMPLDAETALEASRLGRLHKLPLADSIVYASSQRFGAELWSMDGDFSGLAGVKYFPKKRRLEDKA